MPIRLPLALLALLLCSCGQSAFAQDVRYFNKREVRIPFSILDRDQIQEVQLYASLNGGNWILVGRAQAQQKYFRFTTDRDGSYEFGVRTVLTNGRSKPERIDDLQPSRKVIIDTIPPHIDASPFNGGGQIAGVEWDIADENIDPKSIRLEYRWPGDRNWSPIDRDKQFRPKDKQSWNLAGRGSSIEIRIRARDLAGNEAVSEGVTTPPDGRMSNADNRLGPTRLPDPPRGQVDIEPLRPLDTTPIRNTSASNAQLIYSNDKLLKLEYEFRVGASGYKSSELYVKSPQSADWTKVEGTGDRKENQVSFTFNAPIDGVYGFFIRIQNGVDRWSDDAPNRLTPPRLEVMVDTGKPLVNLDPPKVRPANEGQAIIDLSWSAEDKMSGLEPESLKIEYGTAGNWITVVERQAGSGSYSWAVPENVPAKIKLRLTVKDRAGNEGEYITAKEVIVDLQRPSVENLKAGSSIKLGGNKNEP